MAHFAELNSDNIVIKVVVIDNKNCLDDDGNESESVGISFCRSLYGNDTNWAQTSYNSSFRGKYAGIGMTYIENASTLGVANTSIFVETRPGIHWTLNPDIPEWDPPIPKPEITLEQENANYGYVWSDEQYTNYISGIDTSSEHPGWILDLIY